MSVFVVERQWIDFQGFSRKEEVVFGWNARTAKSALASALKDIEGIEGASISTSNKFGIQRAHCSVNGQTYSATEMNNPFI